MDIWSGGRYYDSEWAEDAADDAFAEDLTDLWHEATGAERQQITKERGALDIRDKARREFTATEWAVLSRHRAAIEATWYREEPTEAPF